MANESNVLTAPYIAFSTFTTALSNLKAHGLPTRLDRSVFTSFAGAVQGQVLSAFKFMGLIDQQGNVQNDLSLLVQADDDGRKPILKALLPKRYKEVFAIDLTKASPLQVSEEIKRYNVTGATHARAVRFFLKAAQYAGLPMSNRLSSKTRSGGPHKKRSVLKRNGQLETKDALQGGQLAVKIGRAETDQGESKTIQLRTGGSLTLVLSVKFVGLDVEDRNFVFELIDKMSSYETKKETASE